MIKEQCNRRASETYIDALYYHEKYNSAACWKTPSSVDRELCKLKSKTAKITALKENIRIHVLGLGCVDLATPWSKNGKEFTIEYLSRHLKMCISQQQKRRIPKAPPVPLPDRKQLPSLGTQSQDLVAIDITHTLGSVQFEDNANSVRVERELAGMGDRYSELQPTSRPTIDKKLIGKRLDICEKYNLNDGGSGLRWSQEEVIEISDGKNILKPGARNTC